MQKRFILPLLLLFSFSRLFSQPANDNCNTAPVVVVSIASSCANMVSGTTVNATQSMAPCSGTVANDVWYQFVATQTTLTVNLSTAAIPLPVIEVFSGTCGSLTSLACIDQAPHNSRVRQLVKKLVIGNTYYIRIYSKQTGFTGGTFQLCLYEPPGNDDCSGATDITVNTGTSWTVSTAGNNYEASPSLDFCNATATNDGDTWFKFVAPDSVQLIYMNQTANTPYQVQTYSGDCNNLVVLNGIRYDGLARSCYYPGSSDGYYKLQNLVAGNTYYIRVMQDFTSGGSHNLATDSFYIFISNPTANDACGAAVDVPVNSSTVNTLRTTGNLKNASVLTGN
ncbi:MAG TPA: hypothetical protein VLD19_12360, partial [Chitinophagaceae bacterium]|nr:hypothetical protein [Chitinophagaceae bacterium]